MNIYIDNFDRAQDVMREATNQIHEGFEDLEEYQDAFATNNGVLNVDGLDILKIKTCACGQGGHICNQRRPETYKGNKDERSVW